MATKLLQQETLVTQFKHSRQFFHVITDLTGRLLYSNSLFASACGRSSAELSVCLITDLVTKEDVDKCVDAIQKCTTEPEEPMGSVSLSLSLLESNSKLYWEICMLRNNDDEQETIQWIGVEEQNKTTEWLKQSATLIENEQRFRLLIYNLNLGVVLVNDKAEILICNQATADMFEAAEHQLIGLNVTQTSRDIVHENGETFHPVDFPISIAIRTKKPVRNIVMGIRKLSVDEIMWLLVAAEPLIDEQGNILHVISSFTDITEQKRLARQLTDQELQRQKQLMQATIDGQEKERREIGIELHDNINQYLTTTRLYLEVAKEKAEGEMLTMINQAHKGLLDMVNEIRRLSQTLIPPSLSDIGLVESIQDLCTPLKNTHAFRINFHYDHFREEGLPDNMKLMIFRIIQEQINNIIRHAQAHSIEIMLRTMPTRLTLSIVDDGRGFDPKTVKRGHGFDNIGHRADLFGGKLKIDAAAGRGCAIHVTIPVK